jgi:integrase
MKLTDATVAALKLPQGKNELLTFDEATRGFGVRLREGGKRTWIVQYRVGPRQRRLSLGTVGIVDAATARRFAKEALAGIQLGADPQAAKAAGRVPKAREVTLGEVIDRYLPFAERRLKASTYSGVILHLRKHWQPLHVHEFRKLERRHVAAELGRIAIDSGPYGANRSRAALSALFSWAIGEGLTDANPVAGTNKAIEEISRDRVLSQRELALVWGASGDGDYGAIVKLLILTGQRREEVGGILWSEIDFGKALWSIHGNRTKNALPHEVPLSALAVDILRKQQRRDDRDLIFGSRDGSFQGWSNAKAALDRRIQIQMRPQDHRAILEPWRLHDIRRTVATRLGDIGVLPHVVEAILNHTSGSRAGVAGIYNRATYALEKRAALNLWAQRLAAIVEDHVRVFQE